MSSIQIEKGFPIPHKPALRGQSKYPFAQMDVGDSFVVYLENRKSWSFIFAVVGIESRKTGHKFSTRLLEDGSRRVWRVA